MPDRTSTLSVHRLRRTARRRERKLQRALDDGLAPRSMDGRQRCTYIDGDVVGMPGWTEGVRVEKAGMFQWTVVATEHTGR